MAVNKPGSPGWWDDRKERVPQRQRADPMTLERIVSAAITLIDRQGLDGLSMRNLARELNSGTATLYRYVSSRDEILIEVVDAVLGQIRPRIEPGGAEGWRPAIGWMTAGLRESLLQHPNVTPLIAQSVPIGPNALQGRDAMLGVLRNGGLDADAAVAAYLAIVHYVVGFASAESSTSLAYDHRQNRALRRYYRGLPPDQFPHVVAAADQLTNRDNDVEFRFGLDLLLDGLEATMSSASTHA